MAEETVQSLLREAADLLERAIARLDTSQYPPEENEQRGKFVNFSHAKAHMRFADTPRRLRREADFLDAADQNKRA